MVLETCSLRFSDQECWITIVGDACIGKTWLCHRIMKHDHYFSLKDYDPTIEEVFTKNVSVDDHNVSVQIMDTSGQEQYDHLRYLFL